MYVLLPTKYTIAFQICGKTAGKTSSPQSPLLVTARGPVHVVQESCSVWLGRSVPTIASAQNFMYSISPSKRRSNVSVSDLEFNCFFIFSFILADLHRGIGHLGSFGPDGNHRSSFTEVSWRNGLSFLPTNISVGVGNFPAHCLLNLKWSTGLYLLVRISSFWFCLMAWFIFLKARGICITCFGGSARRS
ncbi:hypothetical protein AVEN_124565-1 [Araneus ventricosus]|uniref:Uncharacterized protein n=1 Tax=Araneus ventricosus TaxID=182803 RepID=A0A4Y2KG38_ARAVE|nr:hypothetical protein AVEN_124565-1 [Araneus ventricosus]